MIIINNIKYACEKCIQGHRSSRCDHRERKLVAVRKKGRPISQCDSCREKRKIKQIHQKCECLLKKKSRLTSTRRIMSIEALLV
ncbi:hypothetical protein CU097_010723 [Rhizopus azygosporus]|uniref:Copper-fist-domain-containing protein n=3 Tax=Rhizopus TaxID=4842 RepID=A0A2G4T9F4_RHIZD|nr:copper-fist-domain-containing protein [Rhizopus microsporus ATCC 52813]ORE11825.1 copper-fist-domain-containing protein [Rhizopus microsporus var. microsporus]PHZ17644.1 copper-fist-domain-containing protein [Rhizopus microsporus ATCC 52813]RCH91588.1 hypothetical protein CU097_010723 [Rhizopus azygosporus]